MAKWLIFAVSAICLTDCILACILVPNQEWTEYKAKFNKDYTNSDISEFKARYYYSCNKGFIHLHNVFYNLRLKTYKLAVNQFSDMRTEDFINLFPVAVSKGPSFDSPPPTVKSAPPSYDPIINFGYKANIADQGTKCNSGWANSVAKSIELLHAQQTGNKNPAPLSAQNLIDCAGRGAGCAKQVPQAGFDYLTKYKFGLHLESDNRNNIILNEPLMCPPKGEVVTRLANYSRLKNDDDESLKAYVSNGFPVVVEFNPSSFDFMHYSTGIFQQPIITGRGSHYMVVVGYGTDTNTGMDYWLLQNSFNSTWGEKGLMRLFRAPTRKTIKNAIFPTNLA